MEKYLFNTDIYTYVFGNPEDTAIFIENSNKLTIVKLLISELL